MSSIRTKTINGIIYRGYRKRDAAEVDKIYAQLNNGARFEGLRRQLYTSIGSRCLFVAVCTNEVGEEIVVGMNMYYLNARDIREQTIHEGFIGVIPRMTGKGIASILRSMAKAHFKDMGFKGISTRISLNNLPSLQSAKKMGFLPLEEYIESSTGEKRYYMVANFMETYAE